MRAGIIEWHEFEKTKGLTGTVNGLCMFMVDQKGKRKPKYVLQSWPIVNKCFTRANNNKKLFTSEDIEKVKESAQLHLDQYVSLFTEPGMDYKTESFIDERIKLANSDVSKTCYIIVKEHLKNH